MHENPSPLILAIERGGDHVRLVITTGGESATIPMTPGTARSMASLLLGAAAAVDPAGHRHIIDEIRALVAEKSLEQLAPGRVQWN